MWYNNNSNNSSCLNNQELIFVTPIINKENLCWKCLKEYEQVVRIDINPLGYGSVFDSTQSFIQLCSDCLELTNPIWWEFEKTTIDMDGWYSEKYIYEDEILNFINSFPIESQELFFNSCDDRTQKIDPQLWIDMVIKDNNLQYSKKEDIVIIEALELYKKHLQTEIEQKTARFGTASNLLRGIKSKYSL